MASDEMRLGAMLRAWRDRLSPAAVGLPAARARRAVGLRREDLSDLAGISVDYLVRRPPGRAETPSAQVAGALGRALQLSRQERDHLYRLAGLAPPSDGMIADHIPPGMQRLLIRPGETPLGVFSADWRLIWWNQSWTALLGDPSAVPPDRRSLVRSRFPVAGDAGQITTHRVIAENAEATDRAVVADLRRAAGRFAADLRLAALIHGRLEGNPRFAQLWRDGVVAGHREDRKTICHPDAGDITVDCDVLSDSDTDLKVVIYTTEPGSQDETKLRFTRVIGTQTVRL